jgi:hypothetical protein
MSYVCRISGLWLWPSATAGNFIFARQLFFKENLLVASLQCMRGGNFIFARQLFFKENLLVASLQCMRGGNFIFAPTDFQGKPVGS